MPATSIVAVAQLDGVLLRVVLGDALGEAVVGELVVLVEEQQRLEGTHQAGLVGLGDDVLAVHDVLGAAAGNSQPEIAAPLGRPGSAGGRARASRRRTATARGSQSTDRRQAGGAGQELSP